MTRTEEERAALEAATLDAYEAGEVSARSAARTLGLTLWGFHDMLQERGRSLVNTDPKDFEHELARLRERGGPAA